MSRPNLLRQAITESDIAEYLQSADDFQLEIDIFRACLDAGFTADHAGSYKDPVTGLNRQFDIRARYQGEGCSLKLAIECKALADFFPLVVSRMPRLPSETDYHALVSLPGHIHSQVELYSMKKQQLFPKNRPVGKATFQLGRKDQRIGSGQKSPFYSGDAEVHEKWTQALSSAHDLVEESVKEIQRHDKPLAASLILPVLVVANDTLWVVDYSEDGSLIEEPKKVDDCSIYLNSKIEAKTAAGWVSYPVSHLLVYTENGFVQMLDQFVNDRDSYDKFLPHYMEVVQSFKKILGR